MPITKEDMMELLKNFKDELGQQLKSLGEKTEVIETKQVHLQTNYEELNKK